ncbi:MAG: hypothetical protein AAF710_10490 [Planctomycetota bacterium]
MAVPTTRELNVKVIFLVTLVAVMLLVAIIYAAQAAFFYFQNVQTERQYAEGAARTFAETGVRGDNLDLAVLETGQLGQLERNETVELTDDEGNVIGTQTLIPIDEAMGRIAERY